MSYRHGLAYQSRQVPPGTHFPRNIFNKSTYRRSCHINLHCLFPKKHQSTQRPDHSQYSYQKTNYCRGMKQIYCHTDWAEIAGYFYEQIEDHRLTSDWKIILNDILFFCVDKTYKKNQTQYLETSLYNWFWWNKHANMLHITQCFVFVQPVILKSESGLNLAAGYFVGNAVIHFFLNKAQHLFSSTQTQDSSLFYPIHLQPRSSRWHFVNRLFLLRPPHRPSKFTIIHIDTVCDILYYSERSSLTLIKTYNAKFTIMSLFTCNRYSLATLQLSGIRVSQETHLDL